MNGYKELKGSKGKALQIPSIHCKKSKAWMITSTKSELFGRKKVEGELYEAGEREEIIAAYAKDRILDVGSGLGNLCFILLPT